MLPRAYGIVLLRHGARGHVTHAYGFVTSLGLE